MVDNLEEGFVVIGGIFDGGGCAGLVEVIDVHEAVCGA